MQPRRYSGLPKVGFSCLTVCKDDAKILPEVGFHEYRPKVGFHLPKVGFSFDGAKILPKVGFSFDGAKILPEVGFHEYRPKVGFHLYI